MTPAQWRRELPYHHDDPKDVEAQGMPFEFGCPSFITTLGRVNYSTHSIPVQTPQCPSLISDLT